MARLGVALSFLLLAGCPPPEGAADASRPEDAGPVDAGTPFCNGLAAEACARLSVCGIAETSRISDCEALERRRCERDVGRFAQAGATRIADDALADCVALLSDAGCEYLSAFVSECVFSPKTRLPAAQLSHACNDSRQCVAGGCLGSDGVCGACALYTPEGEPCGNCDPLTSYCQLPSEADGGTPRCVAKLADGAGCRIGAQCAAKLCGADGKCGPGPDGRPCLGPYECAVGSFCKGSRLEPMTAGACAPRFDAGQPCAPAETDPWGGCPRPDGYCLDGQCRSPQLNSVPNGAECANRLQCARSSWCEGLAGGGYVGRCIPLPEAGQACTQQRFCRHDAWCSEAQVCVQLAAEGEACAPDDAVANCRINLSCVAGKCSALRAFGATCSSSVQCLSGRCASGACAMPAPAGAPCQASAECQSRACASTGTSATCAAACFL